MTQTQRNGGRKSTNGFLTALMRPLPCKTRTLAGLQCGNSATSKWTKQTHRQIGLAASTTKASSPYTVSRNLLQLQSLLRTQKQTSLDTHRNRSYRFFDLIFDFTCTTR